MADDPALLNSQGAALVEKGDYQQAVNVFSRAVALRPDLYQLHHNLARSLQHLGRLDEAIAEYQLALKIRPDFVESLTNLGNALWDKNDHAAAIDCFRRAVRIRPDFAEAQNSLGNALIYQGELEPGIAALSLALRLSPDRYEVLVNLGKALKKSGRFQDAAACFAQAIAQKPGQADLQVNLGNALYRLGSLDQALTAFTCAIRLDPADPEAHNGLGVVLQRQLQFEQSESSFLRALELRPDFAEAHANLGASLQAQGRLDEAIAAYDRSLALEPSAMVASNRILALLLHTDYDAAALLAENRLWDETYARPLCGRLQPHDNDGAPDRRLKIGYVSPDFRDHPVGWSLLPLLSNHDHAVFEIFCYSNVRGPDALTERLRACADVWRDIQNLDDDQAAELIRRDKIDLLIDLSLHTAGNRLLLFARQPAPVQATYLGCAGSTGLSTIAYRISDPYIDPPDEDQSVYSEETVHLPHSFWCYQPGGESPDITPATAIDRGTITFGCLTHFAKVGPAGLELWAGVLNSIGNSCILLNCPQGAARERVRARLARHGIAADRVEFVTRQPWPDYMRAYNRIDIILDPTPYGGGVTTCDSLWMGVPVVTLRGQTAAGRGGTSVLSNLDLKDLIATNSSQYIEIAKTLASDPSRLRVLRQTLRARMASSILMDAPRFAREVEAAFRKMWMSCARAR